MWFIYFFCDSQYTKIFMIFIYQKMIRENIFYIAFHYERINRRIFFALYRCRSTRKLNKGICSFYESRCKPRAISKNWLVLWPRIGQRHGRLYVRANEHTSTSRGGTSSLIGQSPCERKKLRTKTVDRLFCYVARDHQEEEMYMHVQDVSISSSVYLSAN